MKTAPSIFGNYQLLEQLGRGGMGVVYRACHLKNGTIVALKTIKNTGEMEIDGIRREIRALARISHPGIVRILDEGLDQEGLPWYAMDFLEGVPLRQYFTDQNISSKPRESSFGEATTIDWWNYRPGKKDERPKKIIEQTISSVPNVTAGISPIPSEGVIRSRTNIVRCELSQAIEIIIKLCAPLAFLHGEGIVHRDLKPDNIMILKNGSPVIVDFGLMSQFTNEENRERLTVEHGRSGTVSYMAPEQIKGEFVDARADLYALGCIFYELLVGHPPFIGMKPAHIIRAHLNRQPTRPSLFRKDIGPEIDELLERLLAKIPRDRLGHADAIATKLSRLSHKKLTSEGPKPKAYLYQSRCAGREDMLGRFQFYYRSIRENRGVFVLIGGESGVGKTRLLMELGRLMTLSDIHVLTGECSDMSGQSLEVFLKPLRSIGDHCRERGLEETERLLGKRGKVFALYLPVLRNLPGQESYPEPAELPPDTARLRLFSYLSETLTKLTSEKPVAILLDNLQWADGLTLEFFEFLERTRPFEKFPLLLFGAYRSESINTELRNIIENRTIEKIQLNRLDEKSISIMVGDKLGISPPPLLFSRYLSLKSSGNPLFVSEYLRLAIETGLLVRSIEGAWQLQGNTEKGTLDLETYDTLPLPNSLQGLLEKRLEGLSETVQAALQVAAVIGQEVQPHLLWAITEFSEENRLDVGDTLIRRHILEKSSSGTFVFSHSQLRDISLQQLLPDQKRDLHYRAAQCIERVFSDDLDHHQAKLGNHWREAGDFEKARIAFLIAARHAKNCYAHQEALRCYNDYFQAIQGENEESIGVLMERGDLLKVIGDFDGALDDYTAVFNRTRKTERQIACLRRKATIVQIRGDIRETRELYRQALSLADSYPLEKARTLVKMAFFEAELQSRHKEAELYCHQALDLIQSQYPNIGKLLNNTLHIASTPETPHDILELTAILLNNFGLIFYRRGDFTQALEFYQNSLKIRERIGDNRLMATAVNIGNVYRDSGNLDKAIEYYQKSLSLFEEIGDKRGIGAASANIGIVLRKRGAVKNALEFLHKYLAISEEIGDQRGIGIASVNIGIVHREQNNLDQSLQFFQKYHKISKEIGDKLGIGAAIGNTAMVYQKKGELDKAVKHFTQYLNICEEIGDKRGILSALLNIGTLHREQEDNGLAIHFLEQALTISMELGDKQTENIIRQELSRI